MIYGRIGFGFGFGYGGSFGCVYTSKPFNSLFGNFASSASICMHAHRACINITVIGPKIFTQNGNKYVINKRKCRKKYHHQFFIQFLSLSLSSSAAADKEREYKRKTHLMCQTICLCVHACVRVCIYRNLARIRTNKKSKQNKTMANDRKLKSFCTTFFPLAATHRKTIHWVCVSVCVLSFFVSSIRLSVFVYILFVRRLFFKFDLDHNTFLNWEFDEGRNNSQQQQHVNDSQSKWNCFDFVLAFLYDDDGHST